MSIALLAILVCAATNRVLAEDSPDNWTVQHPAPFTYWPVRSESPVPVDGVIWSEDFGFTITPGNFQVTINSAHMDDDGSIGGVTAPPSNGDCGWPHSPILHEDVDPNSTNVIISPDGHRLGLYFIARDNGCTVGNRTGVADADITWKAKAACSCSSGCTSAGGGDPQNKCVYFTMGLGMDNYQQNAGQLLLQSELPSPNLARPAGLQAFLSPTTQRINDESGVLRQLYTSQLLADIVVSNDFCYAVNFYTASNFTYDPLMNQGVPTGLPYNTFVIQNPDASASVCNRLRITQTGELGHHQYDYVWVADARRWDLTKGYLRTETRSKNWDLSGTYLTETNIISNPDGSVVFKQVEIYQLFSWGQTNLIQRVVDPDGAWPQTNTWVYDDDILDENYQQLVQITQPSGYWERYDYNSYGQMIKKVAQFADAPLGALESQCRVTTNSYDYFFNGGSPVGTRWTSVETLLGRETKRSYQVTFPGGVSHIVCQSVGAGMDATNNLVTVSLQYTNGPFLQQNYLTQNPDGTVTVYQYSTNAATKTTIAYSGAPDATGTNVVDGTETISVIDLSGNAISNATYDVASGLLLSSAVTLQTDDLGRPTQVQYNDGTIETTVYGCCGIDSQTDREGITTTYTYDDLKRVVSTTRAGITTLYTYDAMGRTLTTTRQGTDQSRILQNVSVYNTAGWLVAETNALNHGTLYSQTLDGNGHTIKTTTNPDGSTRIETYFQDGSLQSVTGTAAPGVRYEYGIEMPPQESVYRSYTKEIKLNGDGSDTLEWTKTYTDPAGRAYKTVYAGGNRPPVNQSFYNNSGQLCKQVDPDGVTTLYQYNARGQVAYTAVDMNANGVIDFGGTDRITYAVSDVVADNGVTVNRARTYVWPTLGLDASNLVSSVETSVDELQTWQVTYNNGAGLTNYSQTIRDQADALTVTTTVAPDGSSSIQTNQMGRTVSITVLDANGGQLSQTLYGYDAHGRQITSTDARNGTSTSFYNNADQVVATLTPSPDGVQAGQLTTNILDGMGRVVQSVLPDNTSVTNGYFPNGLLRQTSGSRTYPVAYTYDYAGRMQTMTTWTNFASSQGAAVTTWNYDHYRGWLASKNYADGRGPVYYYTPGGQLLARRWARGILTSYIHNAAGNLSGVHYSDSTPGLAYAFDRLGRQIAVTNGVTVCAYAYDDANNLLSESYIGGPLDGLSVTNGYDTLSRRTNLSLLSPSSQLLTSSSYSYDAASRLQTVASGGNTATYTYLANSPLVGQVAFANNGAVTMTTTKQYDYLNRLTFTGSFPGSAPAPGAGNGAPPLPSFRYAYNQANQRTQVANTDSSYWSYQYDKLGQVISGKKYWSDGTPVAGQQFTYNFDDIGNRESTASGGDTNGLNLRAASYTANNLNQYVSRDVPGFVTVLGEANSNATVTVNLQRAVRQGEYFWDELAVSNTSAAQYLSLTNLAVLNNGTNADIVDTNIGDLFIPQTPETFGYDADGNLTNSGRWAITWDAENRVVSFTSLATTPLASQRKVDCAYDYKGRRIQKMVFTNNGVAWIPVYTNKFVYDGWNLIAIFNSALSLQPSAFFTWGTDLSGSLQGAGGVGGLLSMTVYSGANVGTFDYAYDGNGNVAAITGANETIAGQWEYGPFGEVIRQTGPMARANPIRFSTKYQDDETGLNYYGYRYYDPSTGRWLGREPLEESASANLCVFCDNNSENETDYLGLDASAYFKDVWQNGFKAADHRLKIYMILEGASVATALKNRPLTSEFLDRYLDGTGTPLTLTGGQVDYIRREPIFAQEENENIAKIINLNGAGHVDYIAPQYIHHYFQWNVQPVDLFSAIHGMDYKDDLSGCVSGTAGSLTFKGKLTIELHDNFNFSDPNKGFRQPFDTPSSPSWLPDSIRQITEEEFRQLELHGYTKPFDWTAKKTENVTVTVTGNQTSVVENGLY